MSDSYALPAAEVARSLASDAELGLSDTESAARLDRIGPNRPERPARPPYLEIAARQFVDPLVGLLIAAALVSALVGQGVEAAAIGVIVVLNAALGFTQEARAERAVLTLRESLERYASVIRDGRERRVSVEDVVPGDLVVLREGERVPADGRIVSARGLVVDESLLTGESVPVDKDAAPVPAATPLAERRSMAYAGTGVTRGRAHALATATGPATEVGRIAGLTAHAKPPATPLQRRVRGLARVMVLLGIGVTLVLGVAMLARDASLEEAFLVGVSVAVAAVPEGLAAIVTIALALGAHAMARRGAIVRRLTAVETLGSATVIASDKTGTLTENRLRVARVGPARGHDEQELLAAGALASAARLVDVGGESRVVGDPIDAALLLAAANRSNATVRDRAPVHEFPFDPDRKLMTVVYDEVDGVRAYLKGAPEVVLARSKLDTTECDRLERLAEEWAAEGSRVLAVAERKLTELPEESDELEDDLELLGLVELQDPLRDSARAAVRGALSAGLRVEILTGDHPATARTIGRELGLPGQFVHARVTPAEKLRLVERLQSEGEVVAVTGDGVNDAPALRQADVGVAMGHSGTEAAREAADLVLTDDDFATIVAAIREGRAIADNIRKFVAFLLSANLGEVVLFAVAIIAGYGVPMTVVQVLLVNVVTDGLPAIALTRDPPSALTMDRPPERDDRLFPARVWAALALIGLFVGGAALAAFLAGDDGSEAQTMAFATVALAELVLVFSMRSYVEPPWKAPRNRYLTSSVAISAGLVALAIYLPALHEPLGTVALGAPELVLVVALALVPTGLAEATKAVLRFARRS
jgi:Ca2+-transporting ATPase